MQIGGNINVPVGLRVGKEL